MQDDSSNHDTKYHEKLYGLIHFTNFPTFQIEQLHILKKFESNNYILENEMDSDGCYTVTMGSERFYQYAKVLHPLVTEPILCAEFVLFNDLQKFRSLINPSTISKHGLQFLNDLITLELKEASAALDFEILTDIRRYTYEAAKLLQFVIHYHQVGDLITTKELFESYPESHIHQAWENIRYAENDIQLLRDLFEKIKDSQSIQKRLLEQLQRS